MSRDRFAVPAFSELQSQTSSSRLTSTSRNLNSTRTFGSGSRNVPSPYLNSTVRKDSKSNLNSTSCSVGSGSLIQFSIPNSDLHCTLEYGDYLEALFQKQIVQDTIKQHETVLYEQMLYQKNKLLEMQTTYSDKECKLNSIENSNELLKLLEFLEKAVGELFDECKSLDLQQDIGDFHNLLKAASNTLQLLNINTLKSKEEYDSLFSLMQECSTLIEKFCLEREVETVSFVAEKMRKILSVKHKLHESFTKYFTIEKEASAMYFQNMSNLLATKECNNKSINYFSNICDLYSTKEC